MAFLKSSHIFYMCMQLIFTYIIIYYKKNTSHYNFDMELVYMP